MTAGFVFTPHDVGEIPLMDSNSKAWHSSPQCRFEGQNAIYNKNISYSKSFKVFATRFTSSLERVGNMGNENISLAAASV